MKKPKDSPETVTIGGKQIPFLRAALIAQEADHREVPPGEVLDVAIPDPAPTHVTVAGCRLTLGTAAALAAAADARGVKIRKVFVTIVEEYASPSRPRHARSRDTRRHLEAEWALRLKRK